MRIGHGYDVHRLVSGRRLVLCGVEIPSEKGLDGHSDADVAVHALMDAILGALAMGDIGQMFPDDAPEFKDADSMMLLMNIAALMDSKGYMLGNLDITIIAEKPKLSPYISSMKDNLATVLNCDIGKISVKATTEEGLGFTGSGEGIAAHSVCTIA